MTSTCAASQVREARWVSRPPCPRGPSWLGGRWTTLGHPGSEGRDLESGKQQQPLLAKPRAQSGTSQGPPHSTPTPMLLRNYYLYPVRILPMRRQRLSRAK